MASYPPPVFYIRTLQTRQSYVENTVKKKLAWLWNWLNSMKTAEYNETTTVTSSEKIKI